ncbi:LOW QUALITY PROTEIN: cell adhesion molecule DSCAM-like [Uloborus diversus]|uniref:LOW QUALITY PROTEIN: cell adhesion molecule DSCAM-like n=1 Tax=Uloborus diversus TaxID=327109 RepID=UPI00240A47FB|nr:LOW QUALITY PROTEIN: cell adhesion molecule DSCAM-like [Uloborus diversus]
MCNCDQSRKDARGPIFRIEPPSRVEFSNNSGTELRCSIDGSPSPKLVWLTREGNEAHDIHGLRHTRSDGTLLFSPFPRSEYRRDVHDAVYQCSATNNIGSILSREVHVRGVIKQRFDPQVYDDFVVRGNTAVMRCHLPTFVKEYVTVDSWIRDDKQILKRNDMKGSSYTVLNSGELLIHGVMEKDSQRTFSCQTRHRLTGEMVISASAGKIVVTEPHASTLPRVTFSNAQVRTEENSFAQVPCVAQGNPPPTYRWMKDSSGILHPIHEDGRIWINQGTLNIKKVQLNDGGKYQCIVRNSIGERRIETVLVVTAALTVNMKPARQVLNIGQEATFNCNVTGYPIHTIVWKKDQRQLTPSNRVRLLSRDVLHITSVRRDDRGMYQCFVLNDIDGAQGSAELKISDVPPTLISAFPEHTAHSGDTISLKCVTTGNPLPRITWYLDDIPIQQGPRVAAVDRMGDLGHVTGILNISEVRVEDSGEYRCQGDNDVGSTFHGARLNVFGSPFVRMMRNVTAVSGEDLVIRCPYGGYPIKGIRWFKNGVLLPLNHRQKIGHGGTLTIQTIQRSADRGEYSCSVKNNDGQVASGVTHVSVVVPPVIDAHYFRESITVDEEARTKLMCVVIKGDPPIRFHWLKNGQPFLAHGDTTVATSEDTSIVTLKKVVSSDRGQYTCVASNIASSTNRTMQLIVNVPPQWTVEPKNTSVILGHKVWIDCAAVGFPTPSILWKKLLHTESSSGDFTYVHSNPRAHRYSNGTLMISDVEVSDAGPYLCQASNDIAAGLSKIISLYVLVPPVFKDPFQTKTVTEESNTTLRCIATGHAPIVITWQKDKSLIDINKHGRFSIRDIANSQQTMSELHIMKTHRNDTGTYSCSAVSDIGSDEATIQYIVQGRPDPPCNITIVNMTSRSVTLQWNISHDGNSHVTGSVIQYQSISDSSWNGQTSQLIVSGAEKTATLRALSPLTLYFVRIVAENALGHSSPSEVVNVTTAEEAPSGSPKEVQVHSTGAQSIKVSWKPPPEDTVNGYIRGYYIGYRKSSSVDAYTYKQVEKSKESEQQSTYITGLQPFTKYDIVVKAFNSAGAGPKSPKIVGKTLETAPPTSPVVQVVEATKSTIEIKWPKDPKDKSAITEYTLHYKSEDGNWQQQKLSSKSDHYTLGNLRCGKRYQLYMTASNSLGTGEPSERVVARTQGAAPIAPQISSFIKPNATFATLHFGAWQSGGCPIYYFEVKYKTKSMNQWTTVSERLDMPKNLFAIRNLIPDREYVVMVTAHSEAGRTQGEYNFRTLDAVAVGPPSSPAFGKRETDIPFYKNVALVVPVVVASLVLIMIVFIVVVCFRKHSQDRRDYEMRKPCSDTFMMSDLSKQITNKSPKNSHYACPTNKFSNKGDYAEPYTCNDNTTTRQGSDGIFATIKRCPTRPIYMSSSYKQGSEGSQHISAHDGIAPVEPSNNSERWRQDTSSDHKPMR